VWKLFCDSANSEVAKSHIFLYNCYKFTCLVQLLSKKERNIHLLDFMQQLPLELILPEVWIHVFWNEFGCWFGESWNLTLMKKCLRKNRLLDLQQQKGQKVFCKSLIAESKFLQLSFTYATNRSGPNTLPCGTPEVTLTSSDNYIPVHNQTFTHCKFSFRLQHIQWLYMNINRICTDFFHCQILNTIHYLLEAASMGEAVSYRNVVYCVEWLYDKGESSCEHWLYLSSVNNLTWTFLPHAREILVPFTTDTGNISSIHNRQSKIKSVPTKHHIVRQMDCARSVRIWRCQKWQHAPPPPPPPPPTHTHTHTHRASRWLNEVYSIAARGWRNRKVLLNHFIPTSVPRSTHLRK
jgi:hypothetical protein